ncbi:inositol monophosphatase family protein [Oceanobacter mangrovi]|uniref:inositol monophosphatase family protein n=1 Tax=Oceanobacter mangrovi TaxID=2862510 RepID=UPI001C8DE9FB|nr:inositol monophosphatase family protein [Oceanobacter mangrovi]
MSQYQPMLTLALQLARQAGDEIARQRSSLQINFKYDGAELVTQADVAADQLINAGIRASFPDHEILSEELAPENNTDCEHLWIIDPIDGTVNYAHGHPQVAVSIAYYHHGDCKAAVVHNPFARETFHALAGSGAFLNDSPIQCSGKTELHRALIATGFPYQKDSVDELMARVSAVIRNCADIRRLGSAALDICWVACGRMDAYYEHVKPWDFAAAQLIAREAGARFGHIYPIPAGENPQIYSRNILIATPAIYQPLQEVLQQADQQAGL